MEEPAVFRLAKLKAWSGDRNGALDVLRRASARSPDNLNYVIAYIDFMAADDSLRACEELEQVLKRPGLKPAETSTLLKHLTNYRAAGLRRQQGVSSEIAASWEDVCHWEDRPGLKALVTSLRGELTTSLTARLGAILDMGCAELNLQKWDSAEWYFDSLRRVHAGTFADMVKLAPAHFAALENTTEDELFAGLPPRVDLLPSKPSDRPTLFLASDPIYFRNFTIPFLQNLDAQDSQCDVHVHLLDGDPDIWRQEASAIRASTRRNLSLSMEASDEKSKGIATARIYYHAVRIIRFYEELKRTSRPLWMLDVDAAPLRDPAPSLARLTDFDLALQGRRAFEPRMKLLACCVGVAPTPAGIAYARLVAAYIAHARREGIWQWTVDQTALYAAYTHMYRTGREPKTWFLQNDIVGINDDENGVFRFASGINKYSQARSA